MNRKQFAWSIAFGLTCRLVAQTGDEEKRLRLHGEVFRLLGVKPGDSVGDIGAGDEGMWSILLSQKVGKAGLVFAEDIDLSAIEKLQKVISAGCTTLHPHLLRADAHAPARRCGQLTRKPLPDRA